jgi:hypothetical protein
MMGLRSHDLKLVAGRYTIFSIDMNCREPTRKYLEEVSTKKITGYLIVKTCETLFLSTSQHFCVNVLLLLIYVYIRHYLTTINQPFLMAYIPRYGK